MVSCIMITAHRREFVPAAIASFQAQTYADRELIVYDNGLSPVRDLIPLDSRIRYFRKHGYEERTVGELRNTAVDLASGDLIAHWDDDDWSAPTRLEVQVAQLGGRELTGFHSMLFRDERKRTPVWWRYEAIERDYAIGTSFLYRRELWKRRPFDDINVNEDGHFIHMLRFKAFDAVEPDLLMLSRIHHGCTSPKVLIETGDAWSRVTDVDLIARAEACLSLESPCTQS